MYIIHRSNLYVGRYYYYYYFFAVKLGIHDVLLCLFVGVGVLGDDGIICSAAIFRDGGTPI